MARDKNKPLSFDDVAGDNDNNINNDSDNNNVIKNIVGSHKTKEDTHVFKGFYLEREVADKIDSIANTYGNKKGIKSELVNEILKKHFQSEGIW